MRIKNILTKKKSQSPTGWYKPKIQPDRTPDVIDVAVISMIRTLQAMHRQGIPFSMETYRVLIRDYQNCATLNDELNATQRAVAIKALKATTSAANLEEILLKAAKE